MRAMVSLVVVMGVLIVAGVGVVGLTIARRLGAPAAAANVVLPEPDGTRITALAATPERLAVLLQGGGPDRVVLIDARSGTVVGRVGLAR